MIAGVQTIVLNIPNKSELTEGPHPHKHSFVLSHGCYTESVLFLTVAALVLVVVAYGVARLLGLTN